MASTPGTTHRHHDTCDTTGGKTMYDMYPDWGPARNDPDSPLSADAVQTALDLRDNGGPRPDDN